MFSLRDEIAKRFPGKKVKYAESLSFTAEFKYDHGVDGVNTSLDSAIARPYRVLMDSKRPVGRINHIFYLDKNTQEHRVVGSICYTHYSAKQKRLIFFPGIVGNRKLLWHSTAKNNLVQGSIDHFTVQPDFKSWHYTAILNGKKEGVRLPDNDMRPIVPGLDYWFGMSVASSKMLEPLYKEMMLHFSVTDVNANECGRYLMEAKDGSRDHIVMQVGEEANSRNEFIHFDFLLDRRWFRRFRKFPKNVCLVPQGPDVRKDTDNTLADFVIRQHKIYVHDLRGDVILLVSKHRGQLSQEVIISAGNLTK